MQAIWVVRRVFGVAIGVLILVVAASAVSAANSPSTAPCWKQLVNEWYSGAITTIYPQPCYSEAIRRLPSGFVTSSAKRDIREAGLAARRGESAPAETPLPTPRTSQPARRSRAGQPSLLPAL